MVFPFPQPVLQLSPRSIRYAGIGLCIVSIIGAGFVVYGRYRQFQTILSQVTAKNTALADDLSRVTIERDRLASDDQYVRNNRLNDELTTIKDTYTKSSAAYEEILKLRDDKGNVADMEKMYAQTVALLSERNWSSASATLGHIADAIAKERIALASTVPAGPPAVSSNTAPGNGYARQSVSVGGSQFTVDIIAGDLATTRVLVDSASDSDCGNNCPVLPLSDYVSRNGGYAGINGSYFCPETYPSCADKKNSFDTLLMNKNKRYLNSDNNVYSTVPAVIFLGGSVRFVPRSLDWGRDTGNDGVLANQPLLVYGGNVMFSGDGDPKKTTRGLRAFVANKGNTVYIGVVHGVSVAESANVLQTLGMENALNLDSGGSTALWFNGYRYGPGRNIPNAIVFVRR